MSDWKREIDETSDPKSDNTADVARQWQPSSDTIRAIKGQDEGTEKREWTDRGIQNVTIDQVNLRDSPVHGENDFKKVSKTEMQEGFEKLETTVRPAVEKGADGDYFSDLDTSQGLDYEHGYRRVYDSFYGNESIRLDKSGNTYDVVNGYHRLSIAKEIGLTTVPARIIEHNE